LGLATYGKRKIPGRSSCCRGSDLILQSDRNNFQAVGGGGKTQNRERKSSCKKKGEVRSGKKIRQIERGGKKNGSTTRGKKKALKGRDAGEDGAIGGRLDGWNRGRNKATQIGGVRRG